MTVSAGRGGSASDVVTITVEASILPGAPANLTAEPGNGRVALSWDNPQDESIAGYQIRLRQAGSPWGQRWNIPKSTGITLAGLVNGTTYTAPGRAVNAHGAGRRRKPGRFLRPSNGSKAQSPGLVERPRRQTASAPFSVFRRAGTVAGWFSIPADTTAVWAVSYQRRVKLQLAG